MKLIVQNRKYPLDANEMPQLYFDYRKMTIAYLIILFNQKMNVVNLLT
jgi:hypothetical protein